MRAKIFFTLYMILIAIGVIVCLSVTIYTRESLTFAYCEFWPWTKGFVAGGFIVGVRNLGTTSVTIVDVHVNNTSIAEIAGQHIHLNQQVKAGETEELGYLFNWSSGSIYKITLMTARGSAFSLTETAKSSETLLEIENVIWDSTTNTTSIVIRNTGTRTRTIIDLYVRRPSDIYTPITPFFTNLGTGKLLPVNQKFTIILRWPNTLDSSWASNQTYCFMTKPKTGISRVFNSSTPA